MSLPPHLHPATLACGALWEERRLLRTGEEAITKGLRQMSKVKGRKLRKGRDRRGVQTGRNARRLCSPVLVEELLGME